MLRSCARDPLSAVALSLKSLTSKKRLKILHFHLVSNSDLSREQLCPSTGGMEGWHAIESAGGKKISRWWFMRIQSTVSACSICNTKTRHFLKLIIRPLEKAAGVLKQLRGQGNWGTQGALLEIVSWSPYLKVITNEELDIGPIIHYVIFLVYYI